MTSWYRVTVEARQPVSVGTTSAKSFLTRVEPLITGSALRGALATWWLNNRGRDQDFRPLFDGEVRYGPLLRDDCVLENLSVTYCKYHDPSADHPRYHDRAFSEKTQRVCTGIPEPLRGKFRRRGGGDPVLTVSTSTAIQADTQIAKKGSLFSREANPVGATFQGFIVGEDELLAKLPSQVSLTLGGRTSVLGSAQVRLKPGDPPVIPDGRVVVRTLSPAILVDAAARGSIDLQAAFKARGFGAKVFADRFTIEGTGGWHAAANLPKPVDIAVARGSVAVIEGEREALRELVNRGIGLRRAEGFGFLEVVGEPWSLGQAEATPAAKDPAPVDWLAQIVQGNLDSVSRQWLAKQLQEVRAKQVEEITSRLDRQATQLTEHQRELVMQVLRDVPDSQRPALARKLRGE